MIIEEQNEAGQPTPRRRLWRFSLKTLLILLTLFCLWLGTLANSASRQKRAVKAIQRNGGRFNYDYQMTRRGPDFELGFSPLVEPPGPKWLRGILGDDYFITPIALHIPRKSVLKDDCFSHFDALPFIESAIFDVPLLDSDLAHLKHLTNLRTLGLHGGSLTGLKAPRNFEFLQHLRKLEMLGLASPHFSDADANYLTGAVNLKFLTLYNSAIGDDGLAQLRQLKNLEMLGVSGTKVTDRGIAYLSSLPKLRYLSANNLDVSDSALDSFIKMSALRDLELFNTRVSGDGIDRLRKAMPKCRILGKDRDGNLDLKSGIGF